MNSSSIESKPLVSVIIPTYNRTAELTRAIKSVLSQTYQNFEIIVVDDHSTIEIKSIVQDFNNDKIKYYRLPEKGNGSIARNYGVKQSTGQYVAFLDSDDEYLPFHLERRLEKIKKWDVDFIFGSAIANIDGKKNKKITRDLRENEKPLDFLFSDGVAYTPTFFLNNSVAHKVQWNETLKRHQDYDYFLQLSQNYNIKADTKPSVIVNWEGTRNVDFKSCIIFINQHKNEISPQIYLNYNKFMHDYSLLRTETRQFANYYKTEAIKLIKHLSFLDYISYYSNKGFIKIQYLKIKYILLISFNQSNL